MKEITKESFVEALEKATNPDALKKYFPAYVALFWQDQKLVATEGHIMLAIDEEVALQYVSKDDYEHLAKPNINALLHRILDTGDCDLTRDELERAIGLVPKCDYGDCEECKGSGQVKVNYRAHDGQLYTLNTDCPVCSGTGRVYLGPRKKVPVDKFPMLLDGQYFRSGMMYKILQIMKLLGIDDMAYLAPGELNGDGYGPIGFRYKTDRGDIYIAAMPNCIEGGKAFWPYDKSLRMGDAVRIKLKGEDDDDPEMPW